MKLVRLLAAATAAALAVPASSTAATLYALAGPTLEIATPGTIPADFTAGGGAGLVTFQIDGYQSIDGYGDYAGGIYADIFTLRLNGIDIYRASFALGGVDADHVFLTPIGATQSTVTGGFDSAGGVATLSVPLALLAGANHLDFVYDSATPQPISDEGWGLSNVSVTGAAAGTPGGSVPEPATWALFLGGFGLTGSALRRRRSVGLAG